MIDQATAWFEIIKLPLASVVVKRDGDETTEIVVDKTAAQVSRLFNKQWLCRYSRPKRCIYDNKSNRLLGFNAERGQKDSILGERTIFRMISVFYIVSIYVNLKFNWIIIHLLPLDFLLLSQFLGRC